jgi:histone H3/H4
MFEYYIQNLFKKISLKKTLSNGAIALLKQIYHHIIQTCVRKSIELSTMLRNKPIQPEILKFIIQQYFSGELYKNILKEVEYYTNHPQQLVFPTSQIKISMRKHNYNNNKYIFTDDYVIFTAAMLEYILIEILDLSYTQSIKCNSHVITPRNIFLAIHYDTELSLMCKSLKICILGTGVFPSSDNSRLFIPKSSFDSFISQTCNALNPNIKISKKANTFLQYYIEHYITKLLKKVNDTCLQFDKSYIRKKDLEYIYINNELTN